MLFNVYYCSMAYRGSRPFEAGMTLKLRLLFKMWAFTCCCDRQLTFLDGEDVAFVKSESGFDGGMYDMIKNIGGHTFLSAAAV